LINDIFKDFFPNGLKSSEKNFSINSVWKAEITEWLVCIYDIDQRYYERAKTRIKQDIWKQEETLAEIRSIYFLKAKKGLTIMSLEPNRVDISFIDKDSKKWFGEVKCPSYVKEIMERDLSLEEKLIRKSKPKNISETFSFNFNGYGDCVLKSLDKFQAKANNLLIISDDRMSSLIEDPFLVENINRELNQKDPQGKISVVLLLRVQGRLSENFETNIEYNFRIVSISSELSL
jgi:hypothetical protein